ncbi:hypothetical protein [Lactobacillus apis]|uniref:hypothetical protein n=1 Tax=Lactobacillus apis TaxID=303541 RepID=UPI00242B10C1|nr:hypothetical protein [Lactobacillus apis]
MNFSSFWSFLGSEEFHFILYFIFIFSFGGLGIVMYVSTKRKFKNEEKSVLELIMNPELKARELKIKKEDAKRLDEILENDESVLKLRHTTFLYITVYVIFFSEIVVFLYPAENIKIVSIFCTFVSALCSIINFILRDNKNNILIAIAVEFYTVTQFFISIFEFGIGEALFWISIIPILMVLTYISKKIKSIS